MEVTGKSNEDILRLVAVWINEESDNLEFVRSNSDAAAVAIKIYITVDSRGRKISDPGTVLFADERNNIITTGDDADPNRMGIWLFPVNTAVFDYGAEVEYIRVKDKRGKKKKT